MLLRRVHSLNDLAERAAMLTPFEDATASAPTSSSYSSSASSSPALSSSASSLPPPSSALSPLASLASASSAIDLLRTTAQQDTSTHGKSSPDHQVSGSTKEAAMALADKKRKREGSAELHHHRHVALRPSTHSPLAAQQAGSRDPHHPPQQQPRVLFNGNATTQSNVPSGGAAMHAAGTPVARLSPSASSSAAPHFSSPSSSSSSSSSSSPSPPSPPPASSSSSSALSVTGYSVQISPNSIHLRDFMDNTKHLLTVMCTSVVGGGGGKDHNEDVAVSSAVMAGDLRLGFGSVVQQVEKASAYLFAEVPPAYEVLRATGLWQKAFLMEVLVNERSLVVDRTLYCGFKRLSQDKFTYFFDADSESLRQLYLQHAQAAAASAFPFGTGMSSGIPFPFSLGMTLPALSTLASASSSSPAANGSAARMATSSTSTNGTGLKQVGSNRRASPSMASASAPLAMLTTPRVVTVDRKDGHQHHHGGSGSACGGCGGGRGGWVKEEVEAEDDADEDHHHFYPLRAADANDEGAIDPEEESYEQPPAKLFLVPEYCYYDPTVLKKRSIRCIPCKMSLSKMGWKQHVLSTFHLDKKTKFVAQGQTSKQSGELLYRSARGVLTCLACAVLVPPQDFDKHVTGAMHTKKRREWAMLDHIERWSDILSKKPRYSTATPLSPTNANATATTITTTNNNNNATMVLNSSTEHGGGCDAPQRPTILGPLSSAEEWRQENRSSAAEFESPLGLAPLDLEGPGLEDLFFVECYPMTPVTGYTQWVALHSTRNWDARNFEVLITSRGHPSRLMVEPLSWKTTTQRGFLFNLAVKFERTYGPDPVQLCLVIRDPQQPAAPAAGTVPGQEQEIQIPLGRAIVCSNSSQRLKRLQQLSEESALTETEQRVIPHYTQCALVNKGREHRYRVKPLPSIAVMPTPTTTAGTRTSSPPTGAQAAPSLSTAAMSTPSAASLVAAALAASSSSLSGKHSLVSSASPVLSTSLPSASTAMASLPASSSPSPLLSSSPALLSPSLQSLFNSPMMLSPPLQRRSPPSPSPALFRQSS